MLLKLSFHFFTKKCSETIQKTVVNIILEQNCGEIRELLINFLKFFCYTVISD